MAYSELLANRIRESLSGLATKVVEKQMMGGLVFMVNGKMCVGIFHDELMCRISHDIFEECLEKPGCRAMELGGQQMKGWILIDEDGMKGQKKFDYWVSL